MIGGITMLTDTEKQFIDQKMGYIKKTIKGLQHYDDPCKLADEIDKWLKEVAFFHNKIVKDGENPSSVIYNIPPSQRPKEGQIHILILDEDILKKHLMTIGVIY